MRRAGSDGLGPDDGPCPRLVLDHDRDAQILGHLLRKRARDHVGAATRRKGDDDPDGPFRVQSSCLAGCECCKQQRAKRNQQGRYSRMAFKGHELRWRGPR
jgi:hypothetical protein